MPSYIIREKYGSEWWEGGHWTPASDEAQRYDTRDEAEAVAETVGRPAVVVQDEAD